MIKLNLGSGPYRAPGYINVDKYFDEASLKAGEDIGGHPYGGVEGRQGKFVEGDILDLPFSDEFADQIEAHQVMEHLSMKDQVPAYKEIYRVLKKGGRFLMSVPSFNGLCAEWIAREMRESEFNPQEYYHSAQEFYGIQVNEGEYHRCPQTPSWIVYCLGQAGFSRPTGIVLFPKKGSMPKDKKFGLVATSPKPYGDETGFRHETILCEAIK